MKQRILIAVNTIIDQGGISTSILNLLKGISDTYDITLCVIGGYVSPNVALPRELKIIPGSKLVGLSITDRRLLHLGAMGKFYMALIRGLRRLLGMEAVVKVGIKLMKAPKAVFDAAIAFSGNQYDHHGNLMVGGDYEYILKRVKAKRKIAWMHNDLEKEGYTHNIALRVYKYFDAIVAVSNENKMLIDNLVPEYSSKTFVVYNTYDIMDIQGKAKEYNPYPANGKFHFVTVARLDLNQKCQDRIVEACGNLKKEGFSGFEWYLVGGGDRATIEKMIEDNQVEDIVHLTGLKTNPYPYMFYADAFVLTSSYEGYGMTIKEAQILGCPTFVTNFGPAHEAVIDGVQGLVCENSTAGVYKMMKSILEQPQILSEYRKYIEQNPIDNTIALNQFKVACDLG